MVNSSVSEKFGQPYRSAANDHSLPADHYRVHLTYAPMPSFADLEKEFGRGNVSYDCYKNSCKWEIHSSCADIKRKPGERIFLVQKNVWRGCSTYTELIAWGLQHCTDVAPNGYRPATHDELYEFQKAHPEVTVLYALGSSMLYGSFSVFPAVGIASNMRVLDNSQFRFNWLKCSVMYLFVARSSLFEPCST